MEVLLPERKKPLLFEDGRRVDTNIVDESDYFFYHFFRMLEVMVTNSIERIPTPRTPPRHIRESRSLVLDRHQTREDEICQTGTEMGVSLGSASKPMPTRAAAALSEYRDSTGYCCGTSLRDIRAVVEACFSPAESPTIVEINRILDMIHSFAKLPERMYFYNYRPCFQSTISIALAHLMGWDERWFSMPGAILYMNEWRYLIDRGLSLYSQGSGDILVEKKHSSPKSYLVHFLHSLHKDRSVTIIPESTIRKSLSLTTPSNITIKECLSALTDVAPKLSTLQQSTHNHVAKCIGTSMVQNRP